MIVALTGQIRQALTGVRRRLVAVAVLVVLIALAAGGGLLIALLQVNLRSSATSAATTRAAEVALFASSKGLIDTDKTLHAEAHSGQFVQVIDPHGRVVAASSPLVAGAPLSRQHPAVGKTESVALDLDTLGTPGDWIVLAAGVTISDQPYVVQVAVPIDVQRETIQTVSLFILAATPILLIAVAVAVWVLVGRTLEPVEQIRRTVAGIDARRLADRVTVPPTGDEIAALATTMNVMLSRLEAADLAQRAFISDAGHELRSPLAAVTAALEAAERAEDEERAGLVAMIGAELARMGGLIEDLMTLARADSEALIASWDDVDLDDVVEQEARRLRAVSTHRIQLSFEPVQVAGDDRRLTQVLRNLLDNAERYARTEIRVALLTDRESGTAVLRIDNDGPVIPVGQRERVFERFVRLDDSREAAVGGRGLGLAITRRIVQAHAGTISVVDGPYGWCRFEVRLPLARTAEVAWTPAVG